MHSANRVRSIPVAGDSHSEKKNFSRIISKLQDISFINNITERCFKKERLREITQYTYVNWGKSHEILKPLAFLTSPYLPNHARKACLEISHDCPLKIGNRESQYVLNESGFHILELKGQCHQIFHLWFFSSNNFSWP